jgi:hypothetical protein
MGDAPLSRDAPHVSRRGEKMMPGKAVSVVRLQPARVNEDNVFFELHRLASEQSRLRRTRQILSERTAEIDERMAEIKAMIKTIKTDHGV